MRIRHPGPSDVEEMYECFLSQSLTAQDLEHHTPSSGFYEYPLSYHEFKDKALSPYTLVWESERRIIGYMISYDLAYARRLPSDPVQAALQGFRDANIYHDLLYAEPAYPIHLGARLLDTANHQARDAGAPGVLGATPWKPWKNRASARLLAAQGFSRLDFIKEENLTLALFAKPFLLVGSSFEDLGDGHLSEGQI